MRSTRLPSWIERLLGTDPKPVPPHVFSLDRHTLSFGRFERRSGTLMLRDHLQRALPEDTFAEGLLGGALREPAALREALEGICAQTGTSLRAASLVLPDSWFRLTFAEMSELPRQSDERDQVIRWKLKRLVPFRVEELRVQGLPVTPLRDQEEPHRMLLGFALESLLAQLEELFQETGGIQLGRITNWSLALLDALDEPRHSEMLAVVVVEDDGYTLLFTKSGEPVLHRYKAAQGEMPFSARQRLVTRDLKLTRSFLEGSFPEAPLDRVLLAAPVELEDFWRDWLEEGLERRAELLGEAHLPALERGSTAERWARLAPLVGAARREVA